MQFPVQQAQFIASLGHTPMMTHKVFPVCWELAECMDAAQEASGYPAYECAQLQSVQYAISFDTSPQLLDEILEEVTGGQLCKAHHKTKTFLFIATRQSCSSR